MGDSCFSSLLHMAFWGLAPMELVTRLHVKHSGYEGFEQWKKTVVNLVKFSAKFLRSFGN